MPRKFTIMMTEQCHRRLFALTGRIQIISGIGLFLLLPFYLVTGSSILNSVEIVGHYAIGFCGGLMIAWGGILVSVAADPASRSKVANPTALGFALCALMRFMMIPFSDELVGALGFLGHAIPTVLVPLLESLMLTAVMLVFALARLRVAEGEIRCDRTRPAAARTTAQAGSSETCP